MTQESKKILVVDDDFSQRDLYSQVFADSGFIVITADDGQDAWEKLEKESVDLVFTGIDMPRMDGFKLVEKIRNKLETIMMPIIIFSHLGRDTDREKAKKLYNAHLMVKGYDSPAMILAKVKELLKGTEKPSSDAVTSQFSSHSPNAQQPPVDDEDDRPGNTMI
ncbi:MAG: response regulator [bacterium]|nr:response regulator [bacterium]